MGRWRVTVTKSRANDWGSATPGKPFPGVASFSQDEIVKSKCYLFTIQLFPRKIKEGVRVRNISYFLLPHDGVDET